MICGFEPSRKVGLNVPNTGKVRKCREEKSRNPARGRASQLITDHVRSAREGNIFTGVCPSVHGGGGVHPDWVLSDQVLSGGGGMGLTRSCLVEGGWVHPDRVLSEERGVLTC